MVEAFKCIFRPKLPHLPSEPISETSLPFLLASGISVQNFNSFIESQEGSSGYKFEYNKGNIFVVDMCFTEHEAVIGVLRKFFCAPCASSTGYNSPIQIYGQPLHYSPAGDGTRISPDLAIHPFRTYVSNLNVPHPGPPPSDLRGNPHARIICEIAMSQSYSNLSLKCNLWNREPYVQSVLGIKLYDVQITRNNPLGERDRAMKATLWRGTQEHSWGFGTVNEDGSPIGPNGCNVLNDPDYLIRIPISDVFYDPAIPAIGYVPLPPPPRHLLSNKNFFEIDLFQVQQTVLYTQAK